MAKIVFVILRDRSGLVLLTGCWRIRRWCFATANLPSKVTWTRISFTGSCMCYICSHLSLILISYSCCIPTKDGSLCWTGPSFPCIEIPFRVSALKESVENAVLVQCEAVGRSLQLLYRARLKGGPQVWWIVFVVLHSTFAWLYLQHSRNPGNTF